SRCQSSAALSARSTPRRSYLTHGCTPASKRARSARPAASSRNSPRAERNLSAFHGAGLWLAVSMMPPAARRRSTAIGVVGVEAARVKRGLGTREKISRPRAHRPRIRLELRGPRLPAALPPLPAPGERAHASRQQEHDLSPERNAELVQQLPLRSQDETGNA